MSGGDTGLELGGVRPRSEYPLFLRWRRQTAQLSNEAKERLAQAGQQGRQERKDDAQGPAMGRLQAWREAPSRDRDRAQPGPAGTCR